MQKKQEAASEELYGELGRAFNFTQGDLEANRAGFVSHRQAQLRKNVIIGEGIALLASWLFSIVFGICAISFQVYLGDTIAILLSVGLLLIIPSLVLFWASRHFLDRYLPEIKNRRVEKIIRRIKIEPKYAKGHQYYSIVSEDMEFNGEFNLKDFRAKSLPYAIYFLPNGKIIMSLEETLPE